MRVVDPELAVHPLRLELDDDQMADIFQGIQDDADWMSLEEIEAAQDWLYDHIAAKLQTVEGVTTLQ